MTSAREAPLVSVLIPVFNCARYLGDAIESVRNQTYRPIEVIVVDDGSDDGSGEVAKRYGPFVQYVYQANAGNGAARNRAVSLARGRFFAFLDADDLFSAGKLERQMAAFDTDPGLDVVFGHMREFISPDLEDASAVPLRPAVERAPGYLTSVMLVRREAFDRVGPFSTALKVGVWVDWYARMAEQGLRSLLLPDIVLQRRLHAGNNGIREQESRTQYVRVLKAALDRRRRGQPQES